MAMVGSPSFRSGVLVITVPVLARASVVLSPDHQLDDIVLTGRVAFASAAGD